MQPFKSNLAVAVTAALAATVLAPVLVPIITAAGRPLAKSLLKGGVILYEKGRETVAGAGEVMEDLIAEVRSELEQQPRTAAGAAAQPAGAAMSDVDYAQQPVAAASEPGEEARAPRKASAAARPGGNGAQM